LKDDLLTPPMGSSRLKKNQLRRRSNILSEEAEEEEAIFCVASLLDDFVCWEFCR
jgi:hypothetical protein